MKFFLLFFLTYSLLRGEELRYPYRDIHAPLFALAPGVRIVVSSPPRTGSTLVYNILQYLFEDRSCLFSDQGKRVKKMHTLRPLLKEKETLHQLYLFCPLRDPMSQFASLLRIGKVPCGDFQKVEKKFKHYLKESFHFLRHGRRFPHFSLLLYETFGKDFSSIFCAIEKEFCIEIEEKDRDHIRSIFSKEALKIIADGMDTFEEADPITGIHGLHISSASTYWPLKEHKEFERLSKPLTRALHRLQ